MMLMPRKNEFDLFGGFLDDPFFNESKYGDKNKALVKTGNYKTLIGTHVFSYVEKDGIFKDVDVLGNEFGGYYFEIDKNKITKYPAEKFEQTRKKLYRR